MKRLGLSLVATLVALLLAVGCEAPTSPPNNAVITVPATAITVSPTIVALEVGGTATLTPGLTPTNANDGVTWSSSDATKASVTQAGVVTALATGTTTITVASKTDGNIKATSAVTVVAAGGIVSVANSLVFLNQTGVNATSTQSLPSLVAGVLTLDNTNTDSLVKNSVEKNTVVYYKTAMAGDFTFKARVKISARTPSSADRGVTVAAYAMTGTDFGTAPPMAGVMYRARGDIRSYYHTGSGYSAGSPNIVNDTTNTFDVERDIEVIRDQAVGYTINIKVPKTGALEKIAGVDQTATIPNASLSTAVTGTSPVYLALTAGGVTANFSNIQIFATKDGSGTAVYTSSTPLLAASPVPLKGITVTGPLNNATYDAVSNPTGYHYQNILSAVPAGGLQLTASASPAYADNTTVTWLSSDDKVATVSATGLVNILKGGSATITATSADGGFTGIYAVNIPTGASPVTAIAISAPSTLMAGLKAYPSVTITPSYATVQTVTWTSSNTAAATIDATTGVITAVAAGATTITATATDSGAAKGTAALTVTAFATPLWSWSAATDATFSISNPPSKVKGYTMTGIAATGLAFNATTGVVLSNGRFVLGSASANSAAGGGTLNATTGTTMPTDGEFNFTKPVKVTIGYSAQSGTANNGFTLYLNNNTTSDSGTTSMLFQTANATATPPVLGISSKLYETSGATATQAPVLSAGGGTMVFSLDPATFTLNPQTLAKAFLQFRSSSSTSVTITSIKVEYLP